MSKIFKVIGCIASVAAIAGAFVLIFRNKK